MRVCHQLAIVSLLLIPVVVSWAEEQPALFSGPQVGEKLPPLKVTRPFADDSANVDLIELAAGRPTLLVFVNGTNAPAGLLTRTLMNFAEMRGDKLAAGVVNLGNDRSAYEKFLMQPGKGWWATTPVGASADYFEGPGSYGLNRNVNLTVLVANKGIVKANFPLIQPDRVDAPRILKEVVALAGGMVPSVAEAAFLSVPTPLSTPDVKLRELVCAALAASDEIAARSSAAAVDEYLKNDKTRQTELGRSMAIFLARSGVAGLKDLPIIEQLRDWRYEYGPTRTRRR